MLTSNVSKMEKKTNMKTIVLKNEINTLTHDVRIYPVIAI